MALHNLRCFTYLFDMLMLGVGVGVSCQKRYIDELPRIVACTGLVRHVPKEDADIVVPDTREGWTKLIQRVLEAYFFEYKRHDRAFTYSTALIRPAGTPLQDFGGIASGPACLIEGVQQLCTIFDKRIRAGGHRLTSVDVMDIVCILGGIVCAGNNRRSAIMVLGDCWDLDYLQAKRWDRKHIPSWRTYCNTSVICNDIANLPPEFWCGYTGNGEPYGLCNLELMRRQGRTSDPPRMSENGPWPEDGQIDGCNPCAEIGLGSFEMCCLAECFLPRLG